MKSGQKSHKPRRRSCWTNILPALALSLLAGSLFAPPFPSAEAGGKSRKKKSEQTVFRQNPPLPPITTEPSGSKTLFSHNAQEQCRATVMPSFINHSMGLNSRLAYKSLRSVSPPSVHVISAGNGHPSPVSKTITSMSKDFGAIVVGGIGPDGRRASYSSQGEAVHILAPTSGSASLNLTSANDDGRFRAFGGTSGAAPLVTGSLAGFEWLAGYHPTAQEAKTLLAKTAVFTRYSDDKPPKNGAGMVNAYKLAMVGKRLRTLCGRDLSCFQRKIQDDVTYKFSEDEGAAEAAGRAFPQCAGAGAQSNLKAGASCGDKAAAFKRLRKAAFLNPSNREHWRQIACIYSEGGFHKNSEGALSFYNNLSGAYGKSPAYCKSDSDCVLAPDCPSSLSLGGKKKAVAGFIAISPAKKALAPPNYFTGPQQAAPQAGPAGQAKKRGFVSMNLSAAEEHYVRCMGVKGGAVLCNGKRRCGREETVNSEDGRRFWTYRSYCSGSQCFMSIGGGAREISKDMPPAPKKRSPPSEGSSGRR